MSNFNAATLEKFVGLARHIAAHADDALPLADLAARVQLSPSRCQRVFTAIFGLSPKKFQRAARGARFRALLRDGAEVTEAIYAAGFGSTSRLYGEALHQVGMTPRNYRAGGAGETLYWACRDTVLGPLLMAATERGVCFAQFGADADALLAQLRAEFPRARFEPASAGAGPELDRWIAALNAYLARRQPRPELPLDLRGTAFQVKVWEFLLGLAEGEVVSYAELARGIGRPRAARAAASACARNRVAVLVPCHRVLRGDGGLGGYRWGIERKRALLDGERAAARR